MMRVLDLSLLLPGPYCSRIFADWGAEVIKVERPGQGDWLRHLPPLDPQGGEGLLFHALNRGKKSLTLNLKTAEGRAILHQLVETADLLLESFRPGVMERLDLGYEALAQINPRLVYCSLSGYGPAGPYRERAGHDLNYAGLAGLLDLTGSRGGAPTIPGAPVADLMGALWAAVGILLALLGREETGKGQRVDGSLLGGALSCLPLGIARYQGGQPMERGEIESDLNLDLSQPVLLMTQHPVTTEVEAAAEQMRITLEAVKAVGVQTVISYPNADSGGRAMIRVLEECESWPFLRIRPSLGQRRYVSLLRYANAMVGNSSSGIIEAPFFGLPVVNIGSRQQGRQRAENVLDVPHDREAIEEAIRKVLGDEMIIRRARHCTNPYGDGRAGERIAQVLAEIPLPREFLQKRLTY